MPNTTQTEKVIALATLADKAFVLRRRDNGDEFWSYDDEKAPEWLQDVCRDAHSGMLPDDRRYAMIRNAFRALAEQDDEAELDELAYEFADGEPSGYNAERVEWLASHIQRGAYVTEAVEEYGFSSAGFDIYDTIARGWYREAKEIFNLVLGALRDLADVATSRA